MAGFEDMHPREYSSSMDLTDFRTGEEIRVFIYDVKDILVINGKVIIYHDDYGYEVVREPIDEVMERWETLFS
jgi:hypothetical protein